MAYDPHNARSPKGTNAPPKKARKAAARKVSQKAAGKSGAETEDGAMFSEEETGEAAVNTIASGQLRAFVERVERLEEEKQTVADDIKEVYAEAKGNGFDTKALRTVVKLRRKDQAERQEEEAMVDLYKSALGMA